jgi:hypothetical protein
MRMFIKRSNGSECARTVEETGRVSNGMGQLSASQVARFLERIGSNPDANTKEHQIGIGGRGEKVPGPFGLLQCSEAIEV